MAPSINLSEQEINLLLEGLSELVDEAADQEKAGKLVSYATLHDDIVAQVSHHPVIPEEEE